jgi:ABC-type nitrate/sulfonate/bicarbonate transport system ATPase subunit
MMLVSHDLEEAVYLADEVLLLTKRPTRIAEILRYDDPRPRTVATLSEPSFIAPRSAASRSSSAKCADDATGGARGYRLRALARRDRV